MLSANSANPRKNTMKNVACAIKKSTQTLNLKVFWGRMQPYFLKSAIVIFSPGPHGILTLQCTSN
jgi:hypothetical protein